MALQGCLRGCQPRQRSRRCSQHRPIVSTRTHFPADASRESCLPAKGYYLRGGTTSGSFNSSTYFIGNGSKYTFGQGSGSSLQPVLEGGGWITRNADLEFSRTYENGAGTATGTGSTDGDLSYLYARAGLLYSYGSTDQVLASAEIGRERMEVDGYSEQVSAVNPFEAHVAAGTETLDLAKLRLSWSHRYSSLIDSTLWVAGVRDFNTSSDLEAAVPGFGTLTPADRDGTTWVEYGARVGVKLTDAVTLDGFMTGVSGSDGIDTRVHGGGALRFQY